MKEKERKEYLEKYNKEKEKGVPFFPDILFKDAVVSLVIFIALVALAYFVGAPLEPRADPADTSYTPRPEWYFLFLFQLLKYFPGSLEVIGVVIIPTLAIILLIVLPFIDRSAKRHFMRRPVILGLVGLSTAGILLLTYQSYREIPPPLEIVGGDLTALLYTENCAPCHGPSLTVPQGVNLHEIIAQGRHEDMPAWSGDLTSDEIDALAGFIISPGGSQLFTENCSECHDVADLVASDPITLRESIRLGTEFGSHAEAEVPDWTTTINPEDQTKLLNFLVAPDGQRLFATNCAPCHGQSVAYAGGEEELLETISQGGMHLDMPPWRDMLDDSELDILARYVVNPSNTPEGVELFQTNCASCHGERIPSAEDVEVARQIIAEGGGHETMPVWGEVLTPEQLDALVNFTVAAASGTSVEVGQELYVQNCAPCHGEFGEGGPNPSRAGDIIFPISTADYLKTRDDFTLRSVIAQGQPNFGMSPFGSAFGGPLEEENIDAIVAYIRSWEANPPVELPPEVVIDLGQQETVTLDTKQIYDQLCSQCHGINGEGGVGPSFENAQFQATRTDTQLFNAINIGHEATSMIGWGEVLSAEQIQQIVQLIREFRTSPGVSQPPTGGVSFSSDVMPLFEAKCAACHGNFGGWDASTYTTVLGTGNNAPVIIPGDPDNSLLAQKMVGTQSIGNIMPPAGLLPDDEVQLILDWIAEGALDN
ncbi:MAG: c-type cytochrome [Chloroflexota bacterium]|nr:MAG: c-type cytochrome [Chloroflexota bacterium]